MATLLENVPSDDPTNMLNTIVENLHEAAKSTIPTKVVRLKGPKWKLSPEAAAISKRAKDLHKISLDPPIGTDLSDLKAQQKEAKHQLRSQLRSEKAGDRRRHIEDIMTCAPGDPAVFAKFSLAQSYSTQKVAGKFSRYQNSFVIHGLDVDPSHLLLLIESLGTSLD